MKRYVLFPALDKVLIEEGDFQVDHRLLKLLREFKGIEITDLKPFYLDAIIPDEIFSDLKERLEILGGEIHLTGKAELIEPIEPPESLFREMLFGEDDEPNEH